MAIETTRPKLLLPGLRPPDPSLEIYRVRPGGATVVALNPDDRFTVIDRDGGQVAEVTALSPDGAVAAEAIGIRGDAPATVLRGLVSSLGDDAREVVAGLTARGLDPTDATAAILFGEWSEPGSSQAFTADRPVVIVDRRPRGTDRGRRAAAERPGRRGHGGRYRAPTTRWSCRRRWPNPGWTSVSTDPRPRATR